MINKMLMLNEHWSEYMCDRCCSMLQDEGRVSCGEILTKAVQLAPAWYARMAISFVERCVQCAESDTHADTAGGGHARR